MSNNINFSINDFQFNYRIVGVTIQNGKILLNKIGDSKVWSLPGGRCEINEDSEHSLEREYLEEMGEKVKVIRPIYFFEYFFPAWGKKIHELSMIYLVEFQENSEVLKVDQFMGIEEGKKILFKWVELKDLEGMDFYPFLLRKKLQNIPDHLERLVDREV